MNDDLEAFLPPPPMEDELYLHDSGVGWHWLWYVGIIAVMAAMGLATRWLVVACR